MTVVTGQEHAAYNDEVYSDNKVAWDKLADAAEFIVAEYIGALDFNSGSTVEKIRISTSRYTISINGERIIREVTSLTINDTTVDLADVTARYWVVTTYERMGGRSDAILSYDYGYSSSDEMPGKMKQAILDTGASLFTEGGNKRSGLIKSESLGDWSATYSGKDSAAIGQISIPNDSQRMLNDFKNPSRLP